MVQTLTKLLLDASDLVLEACSWTYEAAATVFGAVNVVLAPILSLLLRLVNPVATALGDAMYAVLSPLPAWFGITLISVIVGVAMLIAFRYTSNQAAITRVKDEMKAHLLALKLFKDELRTVLRSQVKLIWAILKLQRYVLTPVLIALPPMMLLLAQMGVRYQWRPVRVGETVVMKVAVDAEQVNPAGVTLAKAPGVVIEAGPVPGGEVVVWRLSGAIPGRHELSLIAGDTEWSKELVVGDELQRVSALRPGPSWVDRLLHPVESPLPADSPVRAIEIAYPQVDSYITGADWWILYFFIVSMAVALIFKPVFKVKF